MLTLKQVRQLCQTLEENPIDGFDARAQLIYPLLDEIFPEGTAFEVSLQSGVRLRFKHTGKISKEIILRETDISSHIWEPMTTRAILAAIAFREGSVLIGGAYFGDHAIPAAHEMRRLKRTDSVISVEPHADNLALLLENARENSVSEYVTASGLVLWSEPDLKFHLDDRDSHAATTLGDNGTLSSGTIDGLIESHGVTSLALIVLDIEGSEEQALHGASSTLNLPKAEAPIIIAEIHRNYVDWDSGLQNTPIIKFLLENDYEIFALRDHQGNWELDLEYMEIIPIDRIFLDGPPHGFNIIASKDPQFFDTEKFRRTVDVSPKYLRHRDSELYRPLEPDHKRAP